MIIGINTQVWTWPWYTTDLDRLAAIAAMGYEMVEMSFAETEPTFDVDRCKALLEETGLKPAICGSLDETRDITSPDPAIRDAGVEFLKSGCDVLAELGGTIFSGPLYTEVFRTRAVSPGQRREEWERSTKAMREASKYAAQRGVTIAIEPLNRFETDTINTARQALEYVETVGTDGIGVHLDTFHMNIDERSLPEAIRTVGDRLAHFHACENDRGVPGTGHVPWGEVRRALDDIGYEGAVVFEGFNPENEGMANAARIWRDLGGAPDEMARAAATYLASWVE